MREKIAPLLLSIAARERNTPLERAVVTRLVEDMNLLRLKATARLLARGLAPEIYWWDLLQEAFARVLNGTRHRPPDVPIDVFMTGVMRSIRAEYWRRKSQLNAALLRHAIEDETNSAVPDPERTLLAQEELDEIGALFAADPVATRILTGLGDGLSAEEIRVKYGLSNTEYDSARKRIRRTLLRDGIRCKHT
jgi:DNA-directed RNA polymerase specialized sigma24 family protein